MNKDILKASLEPLKKQLASSSFLASDTLTLADVLYMADLRPAFEKVSSFSRTNCWWPFVGACTQNWRAQTGT